MASVLARQQRLALLVACHMDRIRPGLTATFPFSTFDQPFLRMS